MGNSIVSVLYRLPRRKKKAGSSTVERELGQRSEMQQRELLQNREVWGSVLSHTSEIKGKNVSKCSQELWLLA